MNRFILICTCILFFSSCCNKKHCPSDELPFITVKISGSLASDESVTLYKLENGKRDSSFIQISDASPSFQIFPVNDFDDADVSSRQFIIRYKNRSDTIHDIAAAFQEVEIVCDSRWGCGRGLGKGKTTLKKLTQFGFICRGKNYGLSETLVLD